MATITVFGSALPGEDDSDYKVARALGKGLALAGFTICNGGYGGTMEASARGAREAGGETIGVTFGNPSGRTANRWIQTEIPLPSLIDRLLKLIELGDAYVVLKGGTGTLLELAAVWEFINKGRMPVKPVVAVGGFWADVVRTIAGELRSEQRPEAAGCVVQAQTAEECVRYIASRMQIR